MNNAIKDVTICGFCREKTLVSNMAEDSDICLTCDEEVYNRQDNV